eukprot:GHRQ01032535.1.p3 GENE.GHRQ01032535.1~~GHRQ01032535.1.p3  ORF type:complete len:104 (-),score=29.21 GHRQ01032535.1:125-436(-)
MHAARCHSHVHLQQPSLLLRPEAAAGSSTNPQQHKNFLQLARLLCVPATSSRTSLTPAQMARLLSADRRTVLRAGGVVAHGCLLPRAPDASRAALPAPHLHYP